MSDIWKILTSFEKYEWNAIFEQPSVPSTLIIALTIILIILISLCLSICSPTSNSLGAGNRTSCAQRLFTCWVRYGRIRNLCCSPCDRSRKYYPIANTCQIPFFTNLSQIYNFVFGYKTNGLFIEIGAYDGESFSNTSCLADLGWKGYYIEPIPQYAEVCKQRHINNKDITVVTTCVGETDGVEVELSTAGPFTSAIDDEIETISNSKLSSTLEALGWNHSANKQSAIPRIKSTTMSLNTFCKQYQIPKKGIIDVMIIDVEGFEWPILRKFDIKTYQPKLVIVEIQELQSRYKNNERTQADAIELFNYFTKNNYAILYKDIVNTIFIHRSVVCAGGE